MGLLDDAIREHLDLKRRRGADPADVERAEREALGPVRRDPFEQSDDELEPGADSALAYDQDEDIREEDEYERVHEPGGEDWDESLADGSFAEDPLAAPPQPVDETFVDESLADEPFAHESAPAPPSDEPAGESTQVMSVDELDEAFADERPEPPAGAGAETVEYDVEEALDAEDTAPEPGGPEAPAEPAQGSEEDVLEETPEFLQDTPDHDRLWFEQRPPKDFDFDG
jgi:hypothetical protein